MSSKRPPLDPANHSPSSPSPRDEGAGRGSPLNIPESHPYTRGELSLLNQQRTRPIDRRVLRRMIRHLLTELFLLDDFDVTIHLVGAPKMTRLNETHLQHAGSTDVITFDYSQTDPLPLLAGEIYVCVDEALIQARRFRVTWQAELVRYIIHGILHLQGHDDLQTAARRRMKREEGRRLREMARDFLLSKLQGKPKPLSRRPR